MLLVTKVQLGYQGCTSVENIYKAVHSPLNYKNTIYNDSIIKN